MKCWLCNVHLTTQNALDSISVAKISRPTTEVRIRAAQRRWL